MLNIILISCVVYLLIGYLMVYVAEKNRYIDQAIEDFSKNIPITEEQGKRARRTAYFVLLFLWLPLIIRAVFSAKKGNKINIFILDYDHNINVSYYVDRHASKMVLETAQLLCMAHANAGNLQTPYKACKTHLRHPCTLWCSRSLQNYKWLVGLGKAQGREFIHRYGHPHKSSLVIDWAEKNEPLLPDIGLTPFAQCVFENCKSEDAVEAYRKFYNEGKQHLAKWTNRPQPDWFVKKA